MNTAIFEGSPHSQEAYNYAVKISKHEMPACIDAINACNRFLSDLERKNFRWIFDPALAERAIRFIETLPHTKGKWAGKKQCLKLSAWQKFIVGNIFGWVDIDSGLRRFREAYIEVPRKNGKSALAAAIALYMLVADGESGCEVYCGATTEKQSLEVFNPARQMALRRPALCERFGLEVNARSLTIPGDGSKFEPVIGNPGDGSSPHLWIVDEYHEHKDSVQVDTAITGMGAREQPLLLLITTAGTDTSSPCYDKHREIQGILSGIISGDEVDRIFGIIYGIDDSDDWMDESVLAKANPNYNVSVNAEYLRTQQASAIRNSNNQNKFLIKHLNKWVNAKESWLTAKAWRDCGDTSLNEADFSTTKMVGALDLASRRDVCSFVRVYYKDFHDGRHYYVFGHHFLPEARIIDDDANSSYAGWVADGLLTISGEFETDFSLVEQYLIDFIGVGNVREITYDPWKATHLAQRLESMGVTMIEFRQTAQMMSPAMDELESAIHSGRLHHDGCPILAWMAGNVVLKPYKTDYKTPTKEKLHQKIDGMVALIMGVGRAMYEPSLSGIEKHGIRTL